MRDPLWMEGNDLDDDLDEELDEELEDDPDREHDAWYEEED